MDKTPPANVGSNPGLERTHILRRKPVCATATEAWMPYRACAPAQEKPLQRESCPPQLESSPHLLQLEKAHVQQWRSNATKNNKLI